SDRPGPAVPLVPGVRVNPRPPLPPRRRLPLGRTEPLPLVRPARDLPPADGARPGAVPGRSGPAEGLAERLTLACSGWYWRLIHQCSDPSAERRGGIGLLPPGRRWPRAGRGSSFVGWVERSEPHRNRWRPVGLAALDPPYAARTLTRRLR